MDRASRPVVMAHFLRQNGSAYFETLQSVIHARGWEKLLEYLYEQANGYKTVAELACAEFDEALLLTAINRLEAAGVCYEAHLLAQFGQHVAEYPSRMLVPPDEATVRQLMQLPEDPPGEFFAAGELLTPTPHRQTSRSFTGQPLTYDELSTIAHTAYGIIEEYDDFARRVVPSGGAMYPLQLDYLVRSVEGFKPGLYRWAKHRNGFIYLADPSPAVLDAGFNVHDWRQAAVIQMVSYTIDRSAAKYGPRAHRFALLEAGYAAQNARSCASTLGLGSWEYGGYFDTIMLELLEVSHVTGGMATVVFYGRIA